MAKEKNPNTNCLEGRRCSECGSYGPFAVAAHLWVTLHDAGTDDPPKDLGDTEYDETHAARCEDCQYEGRWGDFGEESMGRPFTVIGICENADGENQPFVIHTVDRSPRLAAIRAIKEHSQETEVEETEPMAIEVFEGHCTGLLGNWEPKGIEQLNSEAVNYVNSLSKKD